jgi:hypothetical protein
MGDLTPAEVEQVLASYRSFIQSWNQMLSPVLGRAKYHPNHPLSILIALCVRQSDALAEAVSKGDSAQCALLFKGVQELNDQLPDIADTVAPFSQDVLDIAASQLRAAAHSDESVSTILKIANARKKGAPLRERWTAVRALRMHNDGKSYPEIADALCDCGKRHARMDVGHSGRLDAHSDNFRNQIRRLKAVLKKYSRHSR